MPRRLRAAVVRSSIAVFLCAMAGEGVAASAESCAGDICVSDAWARATPPGAETGAVYFSVVNKGRAADSLVSASSSTTPSAMVHRSVMTGNIARMEMVARLDLAPGARVTFAPSSYHLMLDGLKQPLAQGSTISVTLDFTKAGKLTLPVPVLSIGAAGPKALSP